MTEPLTEAQQKAYDAYQIHGSETRAARELGINRNSLIKHLWWCAKKGHQVSVNTFCEQAPVGMDLKKTTLQINAEGEIVQRWDRVGPIGYTSEQITDYLSSRLPVMDFDIPGPKATNAKLMLEWKLFDVHFNMFSWAKQTGFNYDAKIARKMVIESANIIFKTAEFVAESVIVVGGDFYHSDTRANTTEKSNNALDVDTRYQKSIEAGVESLVTAVDIALSRSGHVTVYVLSGNHDWHSSIALMLILNAYYRNESRVTIDTSPSKHRFHRFGNNYFMYTHGDQGNPRRYADFLLNHLVNNSIAGVKRKLVRYGHRHKANKILTDVMQDEAGVILEMCPTFAPPDAWTHESAFVGQRATTADLWHREFGKRGSIEIGVDELITTACD